MASVTFRVGDVARRAGVSVRTLHHYHEIGLLTPSGASSGGHRLYTADDLVRLQQIRSLQQLGFALKEVSEFLDRPDSSPLQVLEMHLARLRQRVEDQKQACARLEAVADAMRAEREPSADDFLLALEETARLEKYFSPEQRDYLEQRRGEVPRERLEQAEAQWAEVFAGFEQAMRDGRAPDSREVRRLALRSRDLVDAFTGGDRGVEESLGRMYREEGADRILRPRGLDLDPEVHAFMGRAMQALGEKERP